MSDTIQLHIEGMSCASCVGRIEKALHQLDGVSSASVNLANETASVNGTASAAELTAAISEAGYNVKRNRHELRILRGPGRKSVVKGAGCNQRRR
jgi:Cu+-exporting ATPase